MCQGFLVISDGQEQTHVPPGDAGDPQELDVSASASAELEAALVQQQEGLAQQIDDLRMTIATDAFPMSIGELANLYRDGELNVHPEFQRAFRWTDLQKSRLIESILLGIPLPNIFVAQDEDGKWDVVDGVQRLSTILQFMGLLVDSDKQPVEPFRCVPATYLKRLLDGIGYEGEKPTLSGAHRIDFKRTRLDFQIIKRQSSPRGKFDLFQRLNSYGSIATPQELRNALLVAANADAFEWLTELSEYPSFRLVADFSSKNIEERYHMDVALRFAVFRTLPLEGLAEIRNNINEYLTEKIEEVAGQSPGWFKNEGKAFRQTFDFLAEYGGADTLRRFNAAKDRSEGGLSLTAFEVVALGLGYHWPESLTIDQAGLWERIRGFWTNPNYKTGFATGVSADNRMRRSIPLGREAFASTAGD